MVDHFGVAGAYIDGTDPVAVGCGCGDDEALIEIGTVGGDVEGGTHVRFEIGLAERPAYGDFWGRRSLVRVAFGRAGGGPTGEEGDLGGGEFRLVLEVGCGGQPRRHVSFGGDGGDQAGAFRGGSVGDERKGGDAAIVMTGDAARIENGCDVMGEGGRGSGEEEGQESRDAHLYYCDAWGEGGAE